MLDGVPNFCFAVGYTNSAWTLKVGLLCQYFCRLLKELDQRGEAVCVVERPQGEIATRPLLDFDAGYVKRSIDELPRQGDRHPWEMTFSYVADERSLKRGPVVDPAMRLYSHAPPAATAARSVGGLDESVQRKGRRRHRRRLGHRTRSRARPCRARRKTRALRHRRGRSRRNDCARARRRRSRCSTAGRERRRRALPPMRRRSATVSASFTSSTTTPASRAARGCS